eukprot:2878254-Alexandrium_andersonii.AAC.1
MTPADSGWFTRGYPHTAEFLLMDAKLALLQAPAPHRCEAARHYAWRGGQNLPGAPQHPPEALQ